VELVSSRVSLREDLARRLLLVVGLERRLLLGAVLVHPRVLEDSHPLSSRRSMVPHHRRVVPPLLEDSSRRRHRVRTLALRRCRDSQEVSSPPRLVACLRDSLVRGSLVPPLPVECARECQGLHLLAGSLCSRACRQAACHSSLKQCGLECRVHREERHQCSPVCRRAHLGVRPQWVVRRPCSRECRQVVRLVRCSLECSLVVRLPCSRECRLVVRQARCSRAWHRERNPECNPE